MPRGVLLGGIKVWRHFAGRDFPLEGFCERLFPAEGFELGGISPHSRFENGSAASSWIMHACFKETHCL